MYTWPEEVVSAARPGSLQGALSIALFVLQEGAAGVALEVAPGAEHGFCPGCWGQHLLFLFLLWCLENRGFYKPRVQTVSQRSALRCLNFQ